MNRYDPNGLFDCVVGGGENQEIVPCEVTVIEYPERPKRVSQWDTYSDTCKDALKTAMPVKPGQNGIPSWIAAVKRANNAKDTLEKAVEGTSISWTMLAAIGIRESGFEATKKEKLANGSVGYGRGAFQIDIGKNPDVKESDALKLSWSAEWAAERLNDNRARLTKNYPNLTDYFLLQATAASWNLGVGGISGNPDTIDVGSTGNNYGSNILGLMDCFK